MLLERDAALGEGEAPEVLKSHPQRRVDGPVRGEADAVGHPNSHVLPVHEVTRPPEQPAGRHFRRRTTTFTATTTVAVVIVIVIFSRVTFVKVEGLHVAVPAQELRDGVFLNLLVEDEAGHEDVSSIVLREDEIECRGRRLGEPRRSLQADTPRKAEHGQRLGKVHDFDFVASFAPASCSSALVGERC